jgi:uncharacterized MAPEG superfamily protein
MMTTELTVLALAGLLAALQYALMAVAANRDLGWRWTTSPRDTPYPRPLRLVTGRLVRALQNLFEALILYTAAVVVVILSDQGSAVTEYLAWTWFAARLLYVPAYAFGWWPWRSVIWSLGFFATLGMFVVTLY